MLIKAQQATSEFNPRKVVSRSCPHFFSSFGYFHHRLRAVLAIGMSLSFSVLLMGCNPALSDESSTPMAEATLGQSLPITAEAQIGRQVIQLEVANTPDQQAMGLMYRTSLADDRGMLFPFRPARPVQFWMMNVRIPLDMVFLRQGVVRYIAPNVPPCASNPCPTYGPRVLIDQVIELRGGRAAELELQVGDRVTIRPLTP